jgi:predicted transposase/invertase (TIGR01784 family)
VEVQVIKVEGFQKRVVYNACKGHSAPLGASKSYPAHNDVVAVTICDFALWPEQAEGGEYRVPMLSRWRNQEQHGGALGLGEVQYVFLELPKYTAGAKPETTVEKWAYFFREAKGLTRVPAALAGTPYAEALEVARAANLTEDEWTEYERERMAEQDFRGGIALAEKRAAANAQRQTLAEAILTVLRARNIPVTDAEQERVLHTEDVATLKQWLPLGATVASAEALLGNR